VCGAQTNNALRLGRLDILPGVEAINPKLVEPPAATAAFLVAQTPLRNQRCEWPLWCTLRHHRAKPTARAPGAGRSRTTQSLNQRAAPEFTAVQVTPGAMMVQACCGSNIAGQRVVGPFHGSASPVRNIKNINGL